MKDAIIYWKAAVDIDPSATGPLASLAKVYDNDRDYETAIMYYELWQKADPADAVAKAALELARENLAKQKK